MLNKAKGPVWHKKQKAEGIKPEGLRGIDEEATWGKSKYDGWVYGHGSFATVSHELPFLGAFKWMKNSGNESKRMWLETGKLKGLVDKACMDSKADDKDIFFEMRRQRGMTLLTVPRRGMNKSPKRQEMISIIKEAENQKEYKNRSITVEPMQGVIKDIFELERCWMRGNANNRWLFAAMGVAVQIVQLEKAKNNESTWKIKDEVIGI